MAQWSSIHRYCRDQWRTVASNTSSCSLIAWENKLQSTNCQSIHCFEGFFCQRLPSFRRLHLISSVNRFRKDQTRQLERNSITSLQLDFASVFSIETSNYLSFVSFILPINFPSFLRCSSLCTMTIGMDNSKMQHQTSNYSTFYLYHVMRNLTNDKHDSNAKNPLISLSLISLHHWVSFPKLLNAN